MTKKIKKHHLNFVNPIYVYVEIIKTFHFRGNMYGIIAQVVDKKRRETFPNDTQYQRNLCNDAPL